MVGSSDRRGCRPRPPPSSAVVAHGCGSQFRVSSRARDRQPFASLFLGVGARPPAARNVVLAASPLRGGVRRLRPGIRNRARGPLAHSPISSTPLAALVGGSRWRLSLAYGARCPGHKPTRGPQIAPGTARREPLAQRFESRLSAWVHPLGSGLPAAGRRLAVWISPGGVLVTRVAASIRAGPPPSRSASAPSRCQPERLPRCSPTSWSSSSCHHRCRSRLRATGPTSRPAR